MRFTRFEQSRAFFSIMAGQLVSTVGGVGYRALFSIVSLVGFVLIVITTIVAIWVGFKLIRIPFSLLIGMISPQPAVLGYAEDQAQNPLPGIGYTLMFPFAIIINVILPWIDCYKRAFWRN